jgi:glycosyltransferase involved in cell wall biosynthesis
MNYLSATTIVKNEKHYIKEWLAYYKSMGVEQFYIFDNGSTDGTEDEVYDLPFSDDINFIDFKLNKTDKIASAYNFAVEYFKSKTEWMIFCDPDEFFIPQAVDDLRKFLEDYEEFSGVGANWRTYGSSGHILRPVSGLCVENFLNRGKDDWCVNLHVKSIVKPSEVIGYLNPHVFNTLKGTADENGELIKGETPGRLEAVNGSKIRVNQYFTRAYEDYLEKYRASDKTSSNFKERADIDWFDAYDINEVYDDTAKQYAEQIRQNL